MAVDAYARKISATVTAGGTLVVAHGLLQSGAGIKPNYVAPLKATSCTADATASNTSTVSISNPTSGELTAHWLVAQMHSTLWTAGVECYWEGGDSSTGVDLIVAYGNGAAAVGQVIPLDATRNGVYIQDALVPIAGALFVVGAHGGPAYLSVSRSTGAGQYVNALSLRLDDSSEASALDVIGEQLYVLPEDYDNSTGPYFSTEKIDVRFNLTHTVTFGGAGALAQQRAFVIEPPTYAGAVGKTITKAATMAISGPPIAGANINLAASYALWVQSGIIHADSNAVNFHSYAVSTAGVSGYAATNSAGSLSVQMANYGSASGVTIGGIAAPFGVLQTSTLPLVVGTTGAANLTLCAANAQQLDVRQDANAANSTTVYVNVNGTMQRITTGANDSGGAGFRMLRVPN